MAEPRRALAFFLEARGLSGRFKHPLVRRTHGLDSIATWRKSVTNAVPRATMPTVSARRAVPLSTGRISVANDALVGRTVGGAYTLQELVGVGGMGRVYRSEQKALGRTVAVKVIHPHLLGDEQTVARFLH